MNDIMSYQYPLPDTPPPPYGYSVDTHMPGMAMRSPAQPGRSLSPTMSFKSNRASSHPNLKLDPDFENSNMANPADKKQRNKLNYQRASAACTNCRRRKIRCQAGPLGQEKCATCNKLNKDCKFESVNDGSPTESRHASISRPSAAHRIATSSSSSSPAISSGHVVDMHAAHHHGPMTMPPIHQMGLSESPGLKMETGIGRYPDYGSQGMASSWMGPDSASSARSSKPGAWGAPYGGHDAPPMTPAFPPYNSHSQHQPQGSHATPAAQHAWANSAASDPNAASWGSSYPPPTPSGFSPLTNAYVDRATANKTPSAMPAAEMYPPIPNMDHHGSGAPLSPPLPGSAQSGSVSYGGWHSQQHQSYPPMKQEGGGYVKQESSGYSVPGGGWYAGGVEAAHNNGQAGMPVTDGYYTQR